MIYGWMRLLQMRDVLNREGFVSGRLFLGHSIYSENKKVYNMGSE